jgi:hypothetical protein
MAVLAQLLQVESTCDVRDAMRDVFGIFFVSFHNWHRYAISPSFSAKAE